jgi:hypothetical protein
MKFKLRAHVEKRRVVMRAGYGSIVTGRSQDIPEYRILGKFFFAAAAWAIIAGLLLPLASHAENDSASMVIEGTIVDKQKKMVVENARVWLRNQKTGREFAVFTNSDGEYTKDNMIPGMYTICVQKQGYYSPHHDVLIHESMVYPTVRKPGMSQVLNFTIVKKDKPRLTGVIFDEKGNHITKAKISLKGFDFEYRTDEFGTYEIKNVPESLKTLQVEAEGYVSDEYYLLDLNHKIETLNLGMKKLAEPVSVGPEGRVFKQYTGTTITVPQGALDRIVDMQITRIPTRFIERNEDGIPVPNPAYRFDFKPAGLHLKKSIRVETPALVPEDFIPEEDTEGVILLLDDISGSTEEIRTAYNRDNHSISYELNHFPEL